MAGPLKAPFVLFVLALLIRLYFASQLTFPGLDDPAFYLTVARNLAAGRGLLIDAIWSYAVPFESVTHPSNEYWMPLPSLVLAPLFALFGPGFETAKIVGAMAGALLAPITWLTSRSLGQKALISVISGALIALNPL